MPKRDFKIDVGTWVEVRFLSKHKIYLRPINNVYC